MLLAVADDGFDIELGHLVLVFFVLELRLQLVPHQHPDGERGAHSSKDQGGLDGLSDALTRGGGVMVPSSNLKLLEVFAGHDDALTEVHFWFLSVGGLSL